jgi:hypothetical protein
MEGNGHSLLKLLSRHLFGRVGKNAKIVKHPVSVLGFEHEDSQIRSNIINSYTATFNVSA